MKAEPYVAKSYQDIYETVTAIKQEHFKDSEIWFRGQGTNTYFLKPSLFRTKNGLELEKAIFHEYRKCVARINLGLEDDWETLIDMQHNGVPTRLLDWTDNLGVALYFAAKSSTDYWPMSLYVMNPLKLNLKSRKNGIPDLPSNSMGLSYIKNYVDKDPFPATYPIAVKCNWVNDRVWAQNGMFTIHGDEQNDEEIIAIALEDVDSAIFKFDIAIEARSSLEEYFQISGLNDYRIFPDIQGVVKYVKNMIKW